MKFDIALRREKTCNSMIRFLKYVVMLICLVKVVVLGYNKFVVKLWSFWQYIEPLQKPKKKKKLFN